MRDKEEERIVSAPLTKASSVQRHGPYTIVEVWCNKRRWRVAFSRYLNIISIQLFALARKEHPYLGYWCWRTEWRHNYKRHRSLKPVQVDVVCCALEAAREARRK